MSRSKKWSEQCLVESTFTTQDKTGNEVINKEVCYELCTDGLELYRQNFMHDTEKRKILFSVPFDFFVVSGFGCPQGEFYELEYFVGENGVVYRALLQVVNPVTDIPFVLGVLRAKNYLPNGFNPTKARRLSDIESLFICSCSKDETGDAVIYGHKEMKDTENTFCGRSIVEHYDKEGKTYGMSFDYYRGDVRELFVPQDYECNESPVFVCGSDDVTNPLFKQQRDAALDEMNELLERAVEIADDYGVSFLMSHTYENEGKVNLDLSASNDILKDIATNDPLKEMLVSLLLNKAYSKTDETVKLDDASNKPEKNNGHKAKRTLFRSLDKTFREHGSAAGMCDPGFFPHYSEINVESMRPTWYIGFEFDGCLLLTVYDTIGDLCFSTLFEDEHHMVGKTCSHCGYPKNVDDARKIADMIRKR